MLVCEQTPACYQVELQAGRSLASPGQLYVGVVRRELIPSLFSTVANASRGKRLCFTPAVEKSLLRTCLDFPSYSYHWHYN